MSTRIYRSLDDIPDRHEYARMGRLCEAARVRVKSAPDTLTDDDFAVLACIGNFGEEEAARKACGEARLAQLRRQSTQPVPPGSRACLSNRDLEALAEIVADAIKSETRPLAQRIATLEARPATGGVKWCGVFRQGERYAEVGTLTTHKGSLWLLTTTTPNGDPPGQDPSWRLVVKRGAYRSEDDR